LEEAIAVGEEAYALGTPYDIDLGASVTKGIISGKRKDATRTLIQTDVSISPGNSGGALINEQGTLLGIVNEKVLGMGVEGIGFAIPTYLLPVH
jgi:serine protease Do